MRVSSNVLPQHAAYFSDGPTRHHRSWPTSWPRWAGFALLKTRNRLDDKSNGFQLESSLIRSAEALTRLCLVLAVTTLYLVAQGTEVVKQGKRRWVDPHWFRGQSYLKIGWNWVKLALNRGWKLIPTLLLSSACDPEPSMASKRQYQHDCQTRYAFEVQDAV
jgi:hypothetical protein